MSVKLGKMVKEARSSKGLTQVAAAKLIDGLSAADLGRIERGEKEPSEVILKSIAKALGITQKSLLDVLSDAEKAVSGSAKKTSSSKKTSSAKKTSSSAGLKLTATEKKLVLAYREADTKTKKAAMKLLKGEDGGLEQILSMLSGNKELVSTLLNTLGKK
ncbi:MAG: helix-turn-helix transcriptional regulator [Lachnospiraceae bacterium]|nr:helix-turn-helix transcriptional regulator [Lachnospiraceae bacterium]